MQKGYNEASLDCQCCDTILECRLKVGDIHQDHIRNGRIKGIRGRCPGREISLHVINSQPLALLSASSISVEGFRWLNTCHPGAFSGKEPAEIALTASGIENAFASHFSKERENGWV